MPATSALPAIASLWIGERLPLMQVLSIQSFLAHGHPYHLYVYQATENVPAGVTLLDASQVLPRELIFRYSAAAGEGIGSYAGFANFFRYQLLLEKGGYWVDTDMVCLRPFTFAADVVIASERDQEGKSRPTCCVLRSPRGSPFAEYCVRECSRKKSEHLKWGETGPSLVEKAVAMFQLEPFVQPPDTFCPVDWFAFTRVFSDEIAAPLTAHAVHLWNEMWRRNGKDPSGSYPPQSLFERLKGQYLQGWPDNKSG